jgi:hypothetical protein
MSEVGRQISIISEAIPQTGVDLNTEQELLGVFVDESTPVSEQSDLLTVQRVLAVHEDTLLGAYSERYVGLVKKLVERRFDILMERWQNPDGKADKRLKETLKKGCKGRDAAQENITAHYASGDTLPPSAFEELEQQDTVVLVSEELLVDRKKRPRIMLSPPPYRLGPVRLALALEARKASGLVDRKAAKDVVNRRLTPVKPEKKQRALRGAAFAIVHGLMR